MNIFLMNFLQKSMPEIKLLFLVGVPTIVSEGSDFVDYFIQEKIEQEFKQFADIFQVFQNFNFLQFQGFSDAVIFNRLMSLSLTAISH